MQGGPRAGLIHPDTLPVHPLGDILQRAQNGPAVVGKAKWSSRPPTQRPPDIWDYNSQQRQHHSAALARTDGNCSPQTKGRSEAHRRSSSRTSTGSRIRLVRINPLATVRARGWTEWAPFGLEARLNQAFIRKSGEFFWTPLGQHPALAGAKQGPPKGSLSRA